MIAYLDHAATSPMRPAAAAAVLPWLTERFGNPSGSHSVARAAREAVDEARDVVASALGVQPGGVIFTAGGTEADNLAITGVLASRPGAVVTTAFEHEAVLKTCAASGAEVRLAPVGPDGIVALDALADLLDAGVSVVSVMLVNNEVGTVQPLSEIAELVHRRAKKALLHTDAVQAMPWMDVASAAAGADLVSISAHKFGGPQGVGALGVRSKPGWPGPEPAIHGGGQERGRRSGTHNVAGIVGMAAAAEATLAQRQEEVARVGELRDRLADSLLSSVPDCLETGDRARKVAGNCHLRFAGAESEPLVLLLDEAGVCASAGSACASGAMEASHVLVAMGISERDALGSLRLSLGATTTAADIDLAVKVVPDAVAHLREY